MLTLEQARDEQPHRLVAIDPGRTCCSSRTTPSRRPEAEPGDSARRFEDYDLAELRDYIDWQPFFNAWEMKGKFPDILNNPATGETARKLYDDAQAMLDRIDRGEVADRQRRVRLLPGQRGRRRHRGLHRRVPRRGADHAAPPAPAGRAPRGRPQPVAGRLRGPPRDRPAPTTSAPSRSRPGSAPRTGSRRSSKDIDDYSRDPARVARRPARRGLRRAAARAGPHRVLGLRPRRAPRQRRPDRGEVPRHPAGARATPPARSTPRSRRSGSCSTSRPTPASS